MCFPLHSANLQELQDGEPAGAACVHCDGFTESMARPYSSCIRQMTVQAVRESGMKVEAQLEPSVLTSAAGEDSMSSGSVDMTSSSGDSSSDEGPPLPPPAQFEVRYTKPALLHAKMSGMLEEICNPPVAEDIPAQ